MAWRLAAKKAKIMVNNRAITRAQICMNDQQLVEVTAFNYHRATLIKDGRSIMKTCHRNSQHGQIKQDLEQQKHQLIYKNESIQSSCPVHTPSESWTLTADTTSRIQAFKNTCYRRILGILGKDHKADEFVHGAM